MGIKHDEDKARMDLLPPKAVIEVAKVLTYGAEKYGPNNWRDLDDKEARYIAAALRHIFTYLDGEELDQESGLHHLSHAACSLMFVID